MKDIDWSFAPEGATHRCDAIWYMGNNDDWFYWSPTGIEWHKTPYQSPENFSWWGSSVARPADIAWDGQGLPPVGAVCEYRLQPSNQWHVCEIRYHMVPAHDSELRAIVWNPDLKFDQISNSIWEFRPTRTPEQIAAEVRDREIADLYFTINWNEGRETWPIISRSRKADYAKAIDAGYRKFEITDDSDPA